MTLAGLPQDLLLHLAKELYDLDLLRLLQICRSIRELRFQRTLWLDALANIRCRQMRPLPLCNGADLETLSLQELETAVRRATRLAQNWLRSDTSRPVSIHEFCVQKGAGIFCIPGANIVVESTLGRVSCWDVPTGTRVATLEVPELRVLREICLEVKGTVLIAGSIGFRPVKNLAVISINYIDRRRVIISHVISPELGDGGSRLLWSPVFITPTMMGWCETQQLAIWSMNPDEPIQIKARGSVSDGFGSRCYAFRGSLYTIERAGGTSEVKVDRIPLRSTAIRDALGGNESNAPLASHVTSLPILYPFIIDPQQTTHHFAQMVAPEYGVFAVTHKVFESVDNPAKSAIHFWPAYCVKGGHLSLEPGCFYHHPQAVLDGFTVGPSGTNALLWIQEEEQSHLGLLHYSSVPIPHTTFRKLDTGVFLQPFPSQLVFDDFLGLVMVVDKDGKVTVISYA